MFEICNNYMFASEKTKLFSLLKLYDWFFCVCNFLFFFPQLTSGQCVVLRHHHAPQPLVASGRGQDGSALGWRTAEDGGPAV